MPFVLQNTSKNEVHTRQKQKSKHKKVPQIMIDFYNIYLYNIDICLVIQIKCLNIYAYSNHCTYCIKLMKTEKIIK